ncbi:hypothetical protein [Streptomyces sp. NPDC002952]|uniref:hypothetical protein n=1 Tax=Streptomyces sp. NPDC002952 TaxID=3364673 RepID=UPI0036C292BF
MNRSDVQTLVFKYLDEVDKHRDLMDTHEVTGLFNGLKEELTALLDEAPASDAGMSRAEALAAAREHVEAISTNSRGYQDGVKLSDKVQAIDTFARFLMGESE